MTTTFDAALEGEHLRVTVIDGDVSIPFYLKPVDAAALADSIHEALDNAAEGYDDAERFKEGDRVYYDGKDNCVFADAGPGVVNADVGDGMYLVEFEGSHRTFSQTVREQFLTRDDAEDVQRVRDEMERELREMLIGTPVRVEEDAIAYTKDGGESGVYITGPGRIAEWPGYEDYYDFARNFCVEFDEGGIQVVAMRYVHPTGDEATEAVQEATRAVGARYAGRLGIVPGAKVHVPDAMVALLSDGPSEVVSVADNGMARVSVSLFGQTDELEYPVALLSIAE